MTNRATWEGAKIFLVRAKGKQILAEPYIGGRANVMKESYKHPIGIIVHNLYDTGGRGGNRIEHHHVYYKGKDVEVLPAKDLDHPDIRRIENFLLYRSETDEDLSDDYVPGITYEKPDVDVYSFRKKKSVKTKPKRKVVKKCKCK
jgi:hypothetical protein